MKVPTVIPNTPQIPTRKIVATRVTIIHASAELKIAFVFLLIRKKIDGRVPSAIKNGIQPQSGIRELNSLYFPW